MNSDSRSREFAQKGKSHLVCTEEHNQLFEASITILDSMKIFSITFCTLIVTVSTAPSCKIVLYAKTFYNSSNCAVAHFVLKQ